VTYVVVQYRGPPQFLAATDNRTVKVGEDTELVCHFLSSEATHVSWIKHYMVNGSYVNDENKLYFIKLQVLLLLLLFACITCDDDVVLCQLLHTCVCQRISSSPGRVLFR